jgi:hypothetical protein
VHVWKSSAGSLYRNFFTSETYSERVANAPPARARPSIAHEVKFDWLSEGTSLQHRKVTFHFQQTAALFYRSLRPKTFKETHMMTNNSFKKAEIADDYIGDGPLPTARRLRKVQEESPHIFPIAA